MSEKVDIEELLRLRERARSNFAKDSEIRLYEVRLEESAPALLLELQQARKVMERLPIICCFTCGKYEGCNATGKDDKPLDAAECYRWELPLQSDLATAQAALKAMTDERDELRKGCVLLNEQYILADRCVKIVDKEKGALMYLLERARELLWYCVEGSAIDTMEIRRFLAEKGGS